MLSMKRGNAVFLLALALFIIPVISQLAYAQSETTDTETAEKDIKLETVGVPVRFLGEKLFYIYDRLGPFTPEERAEAVSGKLSRILEDPAVRDEPVTITDGEMMTDILMGNIVIVSVTEGDAKSAGTTRLELAQEYAKEIQDIINKAKKYAGVRNILVAIILSLAATGVVIFLFILSNRLFPKLYRKLESWRDTRIKSVKIQGLEILTTERITHILIGLGKVLHFVIIVAMFYFYVPFVFSLFPRTKGFAGKLVNYILSALMSAGEAFISYIPDLLSLVVIIFATYYLTRFVKLIFTEIEKGIIRFPGFDRDWALPTYKIARFLIIVIAIIISHQFLPGSDSNAFIGIVIFLGVLLLLGSFSAASNIISGIVLIYMRAFNIGDRVKIADTIGDVVERSLVATRVRTIKNVDITIPNSMILGKHIINYSSSVQDEISLILHATVHTNYKVPWRKVHELLIDAANSIPSILGKPEPFVLQTGLNDFYVSYELNAYTDDPHSIAETYSQLYQGIQDKFNEAGIEMTSPYYSAIRDGNQPTIPEDYLPKSHDEDQTTGGKASE